MKLLLLSSVILLVVNAFSFGQDLEKLEKEFDSLPADKRRSVCDQVASVWRQSIADDIKSCKNDPCLDKCLGKKLRIVRDDGIPDSLGFQGLYYRKLPPSASRIKLLEEATSKCYREDNPSAGGKTGLTGGNDVKCPVFAVAGEIVRCLNATNECP